MSCCWGESPKRESTREPAEQAKYARAMPKTGGATRRGILASEQAYFAAREAERACRPYSSTSAVSSVSSPVALTGGSTSPSCSISARRSAYVSAVELQREVVAWFQP